MKGTQWLEVEQRRNWHRMLWEATRGEEKQVSVVLTPPKEAGEERRS